jgi:hypothetical protein
MRLKTATIESTHSVGFGWYLILPLISAVAFVVCAEACIGWTLSNAFNNTARSALKRSLISSKPARAANRQPD